MSENPSIKLDISQYVTEEYVAKVGSAPDVQDTTYSLTGMRNLDASKSASETFMGTPERKSSQMDLATCQLARVAIAELGMLQSEDEDMVEGKTAEHLDKRYAKVGAQIYRSILPLSRLKNLGNLDDLSVDALEYQEGQDKLEQLTAAKGDLEKAAAEEYMQSQTARTMQLLGDTIRVANANKRTLSQINDTHNVHGFMQQYTAIQNKDMIPTAQLNKCLYFYALRILNELASSEDGSQEQVAAKQLLERSWVNEFTQDELDVRTAAATITLKVPALPKEEPEGYDPLEHLRSLAQLGETAKHTEPMVAPSAIEEVVDTTEIKRSIDALTAEQDERARSYYQTPSKKMKEMGVTGGNSLQFIVRNNLTTPLLDDTLKQVMKLYVTLHLNPEKLQDLGASLEEIALLDAKKADLSTSHISRPEHDLLGDTQWMRENQDVITGALKSKYPNDDAKIATLDAICQVLQRDSSSPNERVGDAPENKIPSDVNTPSETQSEEVLETDIKSTLVEVMEQATPVDWNFLPKDAISPDELADIIEKTTHHTKDLQGSSERRTVIPERLQFIQDVAEMTNGSIFYSSKDAFSKSGNFYFVINFEEAGRNISVLENPVYGNATYILDVDAFPLIEGEDVFTILSEFTKRDLRDKQVSAKAVNHTDDGERHLDKVLAGINKMTRAAR